jgi:GNAT superfamily N-acetyltransferase
MRVVGNRKLSRETKSITLSHQRPRELILPGASPIAPRRADSWAMLGAMESDGVTVREARPADAFSVAALHIQDEREQGHVAPPGYLDALSDAWLRDRARRTWLAEDERGRPLGVLHGTRVQKLPSAHRPADAWFHVSLLFVTEDARGAGIGERLLTALLDWAETDSVTRVQLNAVPEARTLYERMGFGPPSERLMELRISDRSRS